MELYTDAYYIQKIQAGDTASFGYLVDKYERLVYSLIRKVVGNPEDAEELAQDAFVKAFRSLGSFKGDCSFSTWIYRIAYNTALSEVRKKKLEFLAIDEMLLTNVSEEEVTIALGHTDTSEQLDKLDIALSRIPPDERALITLFYMKEKTIEEVSFITGLTESNVKTKLFRIRKKLFVLLKEMED